MQLVSVGMLPLKNYLLSEVQATVPLKYNVTQVNCLQLEKLLRVWQWIH